MVARDVAPQNTPLVGLMLHVGGIVTEYRGTLQVRVDDSTRISRRPFAPTTAQSEQGRERQTEN